MAKNATTTVGIATGLLFVIVGGVMLVLTVGLSIDIGLR